MVDFEDDIENCIRAMQNSGTFLYPTDTIWGIGCSAMDAAAVDKVFDIKQRPKEKSMIILLADARDVLQYVAAPPPDIIAIIESFDRPTTVIYDNALGFPDNVVNADGSIAIRVSNDPFCKALIKRYRTPIISTSANTSGRPAGQIFKEVEKDIRDRIDYIVTYRQDDEHRFPPSRLVRISDDGALTVIRA